jgi:hypothetical protein
MVKEAAISIRIPADLKAALERAARDDHRSLTSLASKMLAEAMVAAGYLKKRGKQP